MAAPAVPGDAGEVYMHKPTSPLPGVDGIYHPTSEMPLMKGFMAKFTKAIDDNRSMFEISLMLKQAVDEAKAVSDQVSLTKTLGEFERDRYTQMVQLLHYVHPLMLKAIARGTLAYEYEQNPAFQDEYQYNAKTVPGTYAVSVSIRGREGKFLNQKELERMAEWVDEYAEAAETFHSAGQWDMGNLQHAEHRGRVEMMDAKLSGVGSKVGGSNAPKFAQLPGTVRKIRELARMLRRRIDATLPAKDNVQYDYQVQAPIMIGCTSDTVWECTERHVPQILEKIPVTPTAGGLQSTTPTWDLTLSILTLMKLEFKVVRVAALAIFDPKDLPKSEILLTTVAQSLVWQTGFNIIQGGGQYNTKAKKRGYAEEKDICSERDFLRVNLGATNKRMEQLGNNLEIRQILSDLDFDGLEHEIFQLESKLDALTAAVEENIKARRAVEEKAQELEDDLNQADRRIRQWKNLKKVQDYFASLNLRERVEEKKKQERMASEGDGSQLDAADTEACQSEES